MGQFITHLFPHSEDESEGDVLDVYNPNHYDKCVYEKNLMIRGHRIIMSQELYQKILDYSDHEIHKWVNHGVGPSSIRQSQFRYIYHGFYNVTLYLGQTNECIMN